MKQRLLIFLGTYKSLLISLSVVISIILLLNLFVVISVDCRVENADLRSLLPGFGCMTNAFGEIKELHFRRPGSRVAFSGDKTTGIYCYEVIGNIRPGIIRVFWSKKNNTNCSVSIDEIEELIGVWQRSVILYQKLPPHANNGNPKID